jgi:GTPase
MVQAEVEQFSPDLAKRPYIIAINKVDMDQARKLRTRSRRKGPIHFVSALSGEGLPELIDAMVTTLASAPDVKPQGPVRIKRLLVAGARNELTIERLAWGFVVRGDRVERLVERTDLDSSGGLARFQTELDKIGVNAALEAAGVQPGDTVRIGEAEFEYQP